MQNQKHSDYSTVFLRHPPQSVLDGTPPDIFPDDHRHQPQQTFFSGNIVNNSGKYQLQPQPNAQLLPPKPIAQPPTSTDIIDYMLPPPPSQQQDKQFGSILSTNYYQPHIMSNQKQHQPNNGIHTHDRNVATLHKNQKQKHQHANTSIGDEETSDHQIDQHNEDDFENEEGEVIQESNSVPVIPGQLPTDIYTKIRDKIEELEAEAENDVKHTPAANRKSNTTTVLQSTVNSSPPSKDTTDVATTVASTSISTVNPQSYSTETTPSSINLSYNEQENIIHIPTTKPVKVFKALPTVPSAAHINKLAPPLRYHSHRAQQTKLPPPPPVLQPPKKQTTRYEYENEANRRPLQTILASIKPPPAFIPMTYTKELNYTTESITYRPTVHPGAGFENSNKLWSTVRRSTTTASPPAMPQAILIFNDTRGFTTQHNNRQRPTAIATIIASTTEKILTTSATKALPITSNDLDTISLPKNIFLNTGEMTNKKIQKTVSDMTQLTYPSMFEDNKNNKSVHDKLIGEENTTTKLKHTEQPSLEMQPPPVTNNYHHHQQQQQHQLPQHHHHHYLTEEVMGLQPPPIQRVSASHNLNPPTSAVLLSTPGGDSQQNYKINKNNYSYRGGGVTNTSHERGSGSNTITTTATVAANRNRHQQRYRYQTPTRIVIPPTEIPLRQLSSTLTAPPSPTYVQEQLSSSSSSTDLPSSTTSKQYSTKLKLPYQPITRTLKSKIPIISADSATRVAQLWPMTTVMPSNHKEKDEPKESTPIIQSTHTVFNTKLYTHHLNSGPSEKDVASFEKDKGMRHYSDINLKKKIGSDILILGSEQSVNHEDSSSSIRSISSSSTTATATLDQYKTIGLLRPTKTKTIGDEKFNVTSGKHKKSSIELSTDILPTKYITNTKTLTVTITKTTVIRSQGITTTLTLTLTKTSTMVDTVTHEITHTLVQPTATTHLATAPTNTLSNIMNAPRQDPTKQTTGSIVVGTENTSTGYKIKFNPSHSTQTYAKLASTNSQSTLNSVINAEISDSTSTTDATATTTINTTSTINSEKEKSKLSHISSSNVHNHFSTYPLSIYPDLNIYDMHDNQTERVHSFNDDELNLDEFIINYDETNEIKKKLKSQTTTKKITTDPNSNNVTKNNRHKNNNDDSIFLVLTPDKKQTDIYSLNPALLDTAENINTGMTNDNNKDNAVLDDQEIKPNHNSNKDTLDLSFDLPNRDEDDFTKKASHVLLGGIIIATPPRLEGNNKNNKNNGGSIEDGGSRPGQSECRPDCRASRNELCQRIAGLMRCVCRPGFARMFPDRPCKRKY